MEIMIRVSQPENVDLVFTEPAFHFGQLVQDIAEDEPGIVRGMEFCDDDGYMGWEYSLLYPDLGNYGRSIREADLEAIVEV